MKPTVVNIRELKSRLSHYLRLTKAGEAVDITDRGVLIARIVPASASMEQRIDAIARSGLLDWNRQKLKRHKPTVRVRGPKTVADLLIEDRE